MRECEFLSIDKYEKNIENYSTQLKYECSVFVVFIFLFLFCFFISGGFLALFIIITAACYCYPTYVEVGVVASTLRVHYVYYCVFLFLFFPALF